MNTGTFKARTLILIAGAMLAANAAWADDTSIAAERLDERGDRIEERLDQRGDRINERLDQRGDRTDERLDNRGDRINDRQVGS